MVTYQDLRKISPGTLVKYYSRTGRHLKGQFTVLEMNNVRIRISPETGEPRPIPKKKFEEVASQWGDYERGKIPRAVLAKNNRNTCYIFGLIHYLSLNF